MKAVYRKRREAGLCVTCGKTAGGMARCDSCRGKNAKRTAGIRAKYLAAGLCMSCGGSKERADRQKCVACATDHAWKQKMREARKADKVADKVARDKKNDKPRKKCSRELCRMPAVRGERYCDACKRVLLAELQEGNYLQRLDSVAHIRQPGAGERRSETRG